MKTNSINRQLLPSPRQPRLEFESISARREAEKAIEHDLRHECAFKKLLIQPEPARRAAALGFEGKWAIHPSQIELANKVFTPSEAEVTKAKRIVEAMKQAAKEGKGAVSLDGRLIDIASIRQAEALLNKAAAMGM